MCCFQGLLIEKANKGTYNTKKKRQIQTIAIIEIMSQYVNLEIRMKEGYYVYGVLELIFRTSWMGRAHLGNRNIIK